MESKDEIKINLLLALENLEELYFKNYSWEYAWTEIEKLISRTDILIKDYEDLRKGMQDVLEMEAAKDEP